MGDSLFPEESSMTEGELTEPEVPELRLITLRVTKTIKIIITGEWKPTEDKNLANP